MRGVLLPVRYIVPFCPPKAPAGLSAILSSIPFPLGARVPSPSPALKAPPRPPSPPAHSIHASPRSKRPLRAFLLDCKGHLRPRMEADGGLRPLSGWRPTRFPACARCCGEISEWVPFFARFTRETVFDLTRRKATRGVFRIPGVSRCRLPGLEARPRRTR